MKKVLVAMSGGVDSSVSALLLKEQGFDCTGVMMKLFDSNECSSCCNSNDAAYAKSVATALDIDFFVFNFQDKFKDFVIKKFISCYKNGITPNPCIDCNSHMKFNFLFTRMDKLGYDYLATGHYAKIEYDSTTSRFLLKKAQDLEKDQSYVLYMLKQEQLSRIIFPLGNLDKKKEVRKLAEENKFSNADKEDSQDICFIKKGGLEKFLKDNVNGLPESSDFYHIDGTFLGKSNSYIGCTIGQRKGFNISYKCPLYVKQLDVKNNRVYLAEEKDLYSKSLIVKDVNFISMENLKKPIEAEVRIRYRAKPRLATIMPLDDSSVKVIFKETERAVTPGQSVVFYDGNIVVGGGIITQL